MLARGKSSGDVVRRLEVRAHTGDRKGDARFCPLYYARIPRTRLHDVKPKVEKKDVKNSIVGLARICVVRV